jgi:predicted metal-dependent hydrolase
MSHQPGNIFAGTQVVLLVEVRGTNNALVHLWRLAAMELPPRVLKSAALHQLPARRITVRNQRSYRGSCSRRAAASFPGIGG